MICVIICMTTLPSLERLRLKSWRLQILWDSRGKSFSMAMKFFHLALSDYSFIGKKPQCLSNVCKKPQGTRKSEEEMT